MKKLFALMLVLVLLLCTCAAIADNGEHYTFSIVYVDRSHKLTEDEYYHWFTDQFNIDIEPIAIPWASLAETNSIMVMAGTMYDVMIIPSKYGVIRSYAEQDLVKPLPEGWEEKYPNLKAAFNATGIQDYFSVDGKTYGIPGVNAMYYGSLDFCLDVLGTYYRADWAKQLGFDFGDVVTISEFNAYLKACVDNDMAGNGMTRGLSSPYAASFYVMKYKNVHSMREFNLVDGQYIWGPCTEGTVDGIKAAKQAYQDGMIDPDYFSVDAFTGENNLSAGLCAATYQTLSASKLKSICENAEAVGLENAYEKIKPIVVTDDEGIYHHPLTTNYNWAKVFSPELSDEKFDRLLTFYDYLYSKEGNEVRLMGLKGIDWDVNEEGLYVTLRDKEAYPSVADKYSWKWFFNDQSIHNTDFAAYNPETSAQYGAPVRRIQETRVALVTEGGYQPVDMNVNTLDTEAKRNYSVNIDDEISRIVCDSTIPMENVEAEWNAFIEANRMLWQPVVDDLNATLN